MCVCVCACVCVCVYIHVCADSAGLLILCVYRISPQLDAHQSSFEYCASIYFVHCHKYTRILTNIDGDICCSWCYQRAHCAHIPDVRTLPGDVCSASLCILFPLLILINWRLSMAKRNNKISTSLLCHKQH